MNFLKVKLTLSLSVATHTNRQLNYQSVKRAIDVIIIVGLRCLTCCVLVVLTACQTCLNEYEIELQ